MSNKLNIFSILILLLGINLLTSCDKNDDDINLMIDCDSLSLTITLDSTSSLNRVTLNAIVTGGTTPYTYNWSNGEQTSSIQAMQSDSFDLTVTDANGCEVSSSIELTLNDPCSLFSIDIIDSLTNSSGDAILFPSYTNGTPPYTYSWSEGSTTSAIEPVDSGTYSLTVTDDNGCTSEDDILFTIQDPCDQFGVSISVIQDSISNEDILALSISAGTAPFSYNWSDGSTSVATQPVAEGNYSVTVTDAKGCVATTSIDYKESDLCDGFGVTISIFQDSVTNVDILLTDIVAGTSPYTYLWSEGSNTSTIEPTSRGNYAVTVTDANGCEANNNIDY